MANETIMRAVMDQIIGMLTHSNDYVRKKAVMVLHKFWKINPNLIDNVDQLMKTALCD